MFVQGEFEAGKCRILNDNMSKTSTTLNMKHNLLVYQKMPTCLHEKKIF